MGERDNATDFPGGMRGCKNQQMKRMGLSRKSYYPDKSSDIMLVVAVKQSCVRKKVAYFEWVKIVGQPGLEPGTDGL